MLWSSYGFNEAAIGYAGPDEQVHDGSNLTGHARARGNVARIKGASDMLFLADAAVRNDNWLLYYDLAADRTLLDCYNGNGAGTLSAFDPIRHHGRMNAVMMDGHGESITIPDGLGSINTSRRIQ